jgi:hypothetical protein
LAVGLLAARDAKAPSTIDFVSKNTPFERSPQAESLMSLANSAVFGAESTIEFANIPGHETTVSDRVRVRPLECS